LFREEQKRTKKRKKAQKATLSFALDDEGDEEESSANGTGSNSPAPGSGADEDGKLMKKAKLGKNPAVDTSFLPDREREDVERKEREELRQEWLRKQEELKNEDIEITYSYWDGSGHRKSVTVGDHLTARTVQSHSHIQCKKGDTIAQFLEKCRQQFPELRGVSADNLMYIKVGPSSCSYVLQHTLTALTHQEDLIIPQVGVIAPLSGLTD
jgi:protein FAM50